MGPYNIQFVGSPCGQHGPYTFFKAFQYTRDEKIKILSLGDFFFVKILDDVPICVCEIQLLWNDKNHPEQLLAMLRLYFLPEHTPEGRQDYHGDDEILSECDKVPILLEDLVEWIVDEEYVDWESGLPAVSISEDDQVKLKKNHLKRSFGYNNWGQQFGDVEEEKKEKIGSTVRTNGPEVIVLSYSQYCRYRAIKRRLEGCHDKWTNIIVSAIGGVTTSNPNAKVLFCRETFEHPDVQNHDVRQDHLAPNLRGRPSKKKKLLFKSENEGSNDGTDSSSSEIIERKVKEEPKVPPIPHRPFKAGLDKNSARPPPPPPPIELKPLIKPEQPEEGNFLQKLYKFMESRGTPIGRIPTLGFKEVNLYEFYSYAHRLGGYEEITQKRLWKHIYDKLGGHQSNTSAATCTRRHYEKLLLAYERYLKGSGNQPMPRAYQRPKKVQDGAPAPGQPNGQPRTRVSDIRQDNPVKIEFKPTNNHTEMSLKEKEKRWNEMKIQRMLSNGEQERKWNDVKTKTGVKSETSQETPHPPPVTIGAPTVKVKGHSTHPLQEMMSPENTPAHMKSVETNLFKMEYPSNAHIRQEHSSSAPIYGPPAAHSNGPGKSLSHGTPFAQPSSLPPENSEKRPSVIQHTHTKVILNAAPRMESAIPKSLYGPPHIMMPHKRQYPFADPSRLQQPPPKAHSASKAPPYPPRNDQYSGRAKRQRTEAEKSPIKHSISNMLSPSKDSISAPRRHDQPINLSARKVQIPAVLTSPPLVRAPSPPRRADEPVNLSRKPTGVAHHHHHHHNSQHSSHHKPANSLPQTSPSMRHERPASHSSSQNSPAHTPKSNSSQPDPMSAFVHPAFPYPAYMLPPGIFTPQIPPFMLPGLGGAQNIADLASAGASATSVASLFSNAAASPFMIPANLPGFPGAPFSNNKPAHSKR